MLITASCCTLLALFPSDPSGVDVRRVSYHGWPNCVRMSNRAAELVIVPAIGRIMRFAPAGGPNVLWQNPALLGTAAPVAGGRRDWTNFGGDKLWPAPQSRWGWPPDPYLDGSPWTVRIRSDKTVEMLSPVSPLLGIRFRRLVTLHESEASAAIRNELINGSNKPVEWSLWEVAQVDDPDWVDMPVNRRGRFSEGYRVFPDNPVPEGSVAIAHERVQTRRHPLRPYKIGSDSDRTETRTLKSGWLFTMVGPKRAQGAYPDEGCSVEIYSNPDPLPYMEMEILGPITSIEPGRRIGMMTRWSLTRSRSR